MNEEKQPAVPEDKPADSADKPQDELKSFWDWVPPPDDFLPQP